MQSQEEGAEDSKKNATYLDNFVDLRPNRRGHIKANGLYILGRTLFMTVRQTLLICSKANTLPLDMLKMISFSAHARSRLSTMMTTMMSDRNRSEFGTVSSFHPQDQKCLKPYCSLFN